MAGVVGADVERMPSALFIEAPWTSRSSSRFWVLLVLAAIIATAGVVADSTATVIGAMIVAPLMTPILGIALAVVLADRRPPACAASLLVRRRRAGRHRHRLPHRARSSHPIDDYARATPR